MTKFPDAPKQMVANIYNPQNQTKAQLIEGFVVRQNTFRKLFKAIKEAKMQTPEQHYLILGRRGMGKTTLLLRLAYEIENDAELNGWMVPLVFNEEEYGIHRLFKFWERVMELLEEKFPAFRFEESAIRALSKQHPGDHDAYERALFAWLSGELERNGKKLVLFMDNFGDLARKLNDGEAHRLRKILQTSPDIRLFAASSVVLEAFYKYDHPFYEFFRTVELNGLDEKETRELLLALAAHFKNDAVRRIVEQNPGRVEALRRITGGVIRSIVLLFEIFADDRDGSAFHDLQIILDRVSTLYKHRMDDLSDQQQAIVEAIALHWDAISVKQIVEQTRLDSKVVSAQLGSLEKNGIVEKRASRTKNHLYLIAERFFNIWFLMRLGRKSDQKRVLWLVRFFEDWCDDGQIKDRSRKHVEALKRGNYDPESAFFITQAISQVKGLDVVSRHRLLEETKSFLSERDIELAESLSASDLEVAYRAIEKWCDGEREEAVRLLKTARPFTEMKINGLLQKGGDVSVGEVEEGDEWMEAMNELVRYIGWVYFDELQQKIVAEGLFEKGATCGLNSCMNALGWIYQNLHKNLPKSEEWFLKSIEKGDSDAINSLGLLYQNEHKDLQKAEEWFLKSAEKGNSGAMGSLGWLCHDTHKDFQKAEEWFLKAAEKGNSGAMGSLGWLYQNEYKDLQKAEEWFLKSAEKGTSLAMLSLGLLYQNEHKDLQKAEQWYLKSAEKGSSRAMLNLGLLYQNEYKDLQKAEQWFLKSAEKGSSRAMLNLGLLYQNEYKDLQKAEQWFLESAEKGDSDAMNNLGLLHQNANKDLQKAEEWFLKSAEKGDPIAMWWLGVLYQNEPKDLQKAEQWYLKSAEKGDSDAMNSLGLLFLKEYKDLQKAEEWFLKSAEKGNSDAMNNLGLLYLNEQEDPKRAEEWFTKSAEKGDSDAMWNLGLLYQDTLTDPRKSELWFLKSAEKGDPDAMNQLAYTRFEQKLELEGALEWAAKAVQVSAEHPHVVHTYACILLWNNQIARALELIPKFLWDKDLQEKEPDDLLLFLTLLLAKGGECDIHDLFTSPPGEEHSLKDRYKPIWYAALKKLDHPDFLRMGDELRQTVDEVLARAEKLAEEYK